MLLPRRLAAFIVAALAAGCGTLGLGDGSEGLTPEGTVKGYLDASVTGDCRTASRLSTTDLVRQGLWCDNPRVLSFGEIGVPESRDNEGEVVFVVDAVVLGGTSLENLGLAAGANNVVFQLLRQPDGRWQVNSTIPRE